MTRWVLWTVMLMLGTALVTSCGDDSDGDGPAAGTGGSNKAGTGGPAMEIKCEAGEMVCGTACCGSDDPMTPACCADDFSGMCGMSVSAFGGTAACVPAVETFAGCPSLTIPVVMFKVPSCCTADKMCGLEGTLFGMPGCTELGEAAMRAMQMFMMARPMTPVPTDEDGGVAGAGGAGGTSGGTAGRAAGGRGGMFLPTFPAPQACPAN